MGEYDDVQGFGGPDEIPEPNFESEIKDSFTETEQTEKNVPVSKNSDTIDTEKKETILEKKNDAESTIASIYDDLNENETQTQKKSSNNSEEEKSIEKQINDAVPTQKSNTPPQKTTQSHKKNEAKKLNRRLIFKLVGIFCGIFVLIFIVLPNFQKKEETVNEELEKANSMYIPNDVQKITSMEKSINENTNINIIETVEDKEIEIDIPTENIGTNQDLEDLFPPPGESIYKNEETKTTQQTSTISVLSNKTTYVETARNEQQKDITRKTLPDLTPMGNKNYQNSIQSSYSGTTYTSSTPLSLQNMQQISEIISSAQAQSQGINSTTNNSSYTLQNNQQNKQSFFDNSETDAGIYKMNSKYAIYKGTIITAVLDTAINTDLPGNVTAHVTKNVYSSLDGKYLIIPQGSTIFGEYNSTVTYGQKRVQVVWNTIIRPDGVEIDIGKMNGVDKNGYSGYEGNVSNHPFEYLKAMGLITAYSILDTKVDILQTQQNNKYAENLMTDVYTEAQKLNNEVLKRALDIQPTITIPAKSVINIVTNVTMTLPPLEVYDVTEKYVREK